MCTLGGTQAEGGIDRRGVCGREGQACEADLRVEDGKCACGTFGMAAAAASPIRWSQLSRTTDFSSRFMAFRGASTDLRNGVL
jgi:hypothetical protein